MDRYERQIFVSLVGQYSNLGDVFLRRPLARWLSEAGAVHAYLGAATEGYVEALDLDSAVTVHRSRRQWVTQIAKAPRGSVYAYQPGELLLDRGSLREQVALLPLIMRLRARGGSALRIGAGVRDDRRPYSSMVRIAARQSDLVFWRNDFSRDLMRVGATAPDLAFAEGGARNVGQHRGRLIVSFRGDRPPLSEAYLRLIKGAAVSMSLDCAVVTQVRGDRARSMQIARTLDCELIDWDTESDAEQEVRLRAAYSSALVVISDRLHVLVASATEGAVPVAILPHGLEKVSRHLAAADLPVPMHVLGQPTQEEFTAEIAGAADRIHEVQDAVERARSQLQEVRAAMLRHLDPVAAE